MGWIYIESKRPITSTALVSHLTLIHTLRLPFPAREAVINDISGVVTMEGRLIDWTLLGVPYVITAHTNH